MQSKGNWKDSEEKPYWKWLCCISESDEEENNQKKNKRVMNMKSETSEKNSLCFMGNYQDGNFGLVKLSQKNFFVDLLRRKQNARSNEHIYFSLYDNGIRFDPLEISTLLPEKTLKYIAGRCKELNIVIDAFSRSGSSAIRFGNYCSMVICFETKREYIFNLKQNSSVYKTRKKIELFENEFCMCKFRKVDLVYLHPEYMAHPQFSLVSHLKEDIRVFLPLALQTGDNVILVLPKQTNLNELMTICSFYMRTLNIVSQQDKVELQTIQIDGETANYVLYIGEIAQVQNQDEYEYLSKIVISDIVNEESYYNLTYMLLKRLKKEIPLRQMMDMVVQCCERAKNQDTILQHFLRQLLQDKLLEYAEIEEEFPGLIENDFTPHMNRLSPQSINALNTSSFFVARSTTQNHNAIPVSQNLDYSRNLKKKNVFSFGKGEHGKGTEDTSHLRSKMLESIDIQDNSVGQQRLMDLLNNNNLLNK